MHKSTNVLQIKAVQIIMFLLIGLFVCFWVGAEIHVKDFTLRHAKMLGLDNPADTKLLQQLLLEERERLSKINRKGVYHE